MESTTPTPEQGKAYQALAIEAALRIGLLAGLLIWCFNILRPFVGPIVWGGVIATAAYPLFVGFRERLLGGRNAVAATLFTLIALALLLAPTIELGQSMFESAGRLAAQLQSGDFSVPAPPARVQEWPLIGEPLYAAWHLASVNLQGGLSAAAPQLKQLATWLLGAAAGVGADILKFVFAIVLSGVFLANAETVVAVLQRLALRLVGDQGADFAHLAGSTVRGVAQGVLGVAFIQGFAAGIGMLVMGIPAAGLWALLVLVLAIVQLPALLVLGPVIAYAFSTHDTVPAVLFAVWSLLVGFSDSLLKPMLLGRGSTVPMMVIFIGAIGGFMLSGIVGLFTGAVVFVLGYTLIHSWLEPDQPDAVRSAPGAGALPGQAERHHDNNA